MSETKDVMVFRQADWSHLDRNTIGVLAKYINAKTLSLVCKSWHESVKANHSLLKDFLLVDESVTELPVHNNDDQIMYDEALLGAQFDDGVVLRPKGCVNTFLALLQVRCVLFWCYE
jgi:hypothetical protein